MTSDNNPYAAPQSSPEPLPVVEESPLSAAQRIRAQYLNHEAEVRSVGGLFYLVGIVPLIGVIGFLASNIGVARQLNGRRVFELLLIVPLCVGMGIALLVLGRGLRTLDARTRIPAAVVVGLALSISAVWSMWTASFSFWYLPISAVPAMISGYVLYLLVCEKGRIVFSQHYADVRRQAHLLYRTPIAAMLLLLALVGLGFAASILPALRGGIRP
ncbi:MAG: hypothetical protein K8T25_12165 [Planctomycetia bacterium]|nr:hypothetical protein [Planctomycetia bacterium]